MAPVPFSVRIPLRATLSNKKGSAFNLKAEVIYEANLRNLLQCVIRLTAYVVEKVGLNFGG